MNTIDLKSTGNMEPPPPPPVDDKYWEDEPEYSGGRTERVDIRGVVVHDISSHYPGMVDE